MVFPRLALPSEKTALYSTYVNYLLNRYSFKIQPRLMNFKYRSLLYGVGVMTNNFIYEVTEEVLEILAQAGIPQYLAKYIEEVVLRAPIYEEKEAEVFSVEDLKFSFIILTCSCAISFCVFIMEILIFYIRKFIGVKVLEILLNKLIFN